MKGSVLKLPTIKVTQVEDWKPKATLSRDFLLLVSSWIIFFKPLIIALGSFQIFQKFAEIFASQGAPPVSTTLAANNAITFRLFTLKWTCRKKFI
jgi:hypothetical protein